MGDEDWDKVTVLRKKAPTGAEARSAQVCQTSQMTQVPTQATPGREFSASLWRRRRGLKERHYQCAHAHSQGRAQARQRNGGLPPFVALLSVI